VYVYDFIRRPGKLCAFCGLSERSMLGQREMIRLSCPDGFPNRLSAVPCGDKSPRSLPSTAPSIRRQRKEAKTAAELLDELSIVGYVEEPDVASIVEPSGMYLYIYDSIIGDRGCLGGENSCIFHS